MSNTILTPTAVTREALRVLHQKANFIGTINRQYDDSFAKTGAKTGESLKIRMPNQYTVTDGAVLNTQDVAETSQTLTVSSRKHVGMNFSVQDLTMSLDDFSKRIIDPAMSTLAAAVEADAMSMALKSANAIFGSTASYSDVLAGRVKMQQALAPLSDRTANLCSQDMADIVDGNKALFNDQTQVGKQYREGMMGRAAGYDFMENTIWPGFTTGSEDGAYVVNTSTGITSGSAVIAVTAGTGTLVVGDVFTIAGVFSVHPETKASTGILKPFVVATAYSGGAGNVTVTEAPVTSGATQNCTIVSAGASKAVVVGGTASTAYTTSLLYQKDAFTFATADLMMPKSCNWGAREVIDGISLRIVQDYDIVNDTMPCRVDILYGFKDLRPGHATRLHYTA